MIENFNDLEVIQKVTIKIIIKENYKNHEHALNTVELRTLQSKREHLCL